MEASTSQAEVCRRYAVSPSLPAAGSKVGIARNVRSGQWPLNGLRHPPADATNGWYLWAGEELSDGPSFFLPLHVEHVGEWRAALLPYLALPPPAGGSF